MGCWISARLRHRGRAADGLLNARPPSVNLAGRRAYRKRCPLPEVADPHLPRVNHEHSDSTNQFQHGGSYAQCSRGLAASCDFLCRDHFPGCGAMVGGITVAGRAVALCHHATCASASAHAALISPSISNVRSSTSMRAGRPPWSPSKDIDPLRRLLRSSLARTGRA